MIERAEATRDLLPAWFTLVNTVLCVVAISSTVSDVPLPRDPDPRGPCGNEDCSRCYPNQRWFRTHTLERRRHERKLRGTSVEAARAQYDEGTAWSSDYDTHTTKTLETSETVVEEISNPHLLTRSDGVVIDTVMCWWDLQRDLSGSRKQEEGSP